LQRLQQRGFGRDSHDFLDGAQARCLQMMSV
jgi:hypothetical protein